MLRPKIFTRATEWLSLASIHLTGDGGSPNISFQRKVKNGLKFSV